MRIAHISDLHVLALEGAVPFRLFNKRATGLREPALSSASTRTRARSCAPSPTTCRARKVDHVVITRRRLQPRARSRVRSGAQRARRRARPAAERGHARARQPRRLHARRRRRSRRFCAVLRALPHVRSARVLAPSSPAALFPVVKLRGPGRRSSASRPRSPGLPFVASGELGAQQLERSRRSSHQPEVEKRTPVILLHHPLHNPPSWLE